MVLSSSHICPACGTANPAQAAFCFGCGKPLPASATATQLADLVRQRYRILQQLGRGGFGAVYKAEDTQLGNRLVAMKEMNLAPGLNPQETQEAIEAFKREALLLADLMHPNLPRIYDHFFDAGHWYLVMDFIQGETLEEHLNKSQGGYLPVQEALDIGIQLCNVLGYLHTRQPPIVFRDLKPSNVMLTREGHIYLIDFGIARHFKPGQLKDTIAFGSPGYAAPEQYGRTQTTPQSDVYSLGALLHQMLTGNDPLLAPFRFAPLKLPNQPTPKALADLVARLVEMNEQKRPFSMSAVKQDLQHIALAMENGTAIFVGASPTAPTTSTPPLTPLGEDASPAQLPDLSFTSGRAVICTYRGTYQHVRALSWSPDGYFIASAGDSNTVEISSAQSGKRVRIFAGHAGSIRSVVWSPDGKRIASASEDHTVHIWDVNTGSILLTYSGHMHYVDSVAWSPDSQRIVSVSIDKTARVWDAANGNTFFIYRGHADVLYRVAWSPNGRYIASAGYDSTIQVWNAISGIRLVTYRGHSSPISAFCWALDSSAIASSSYTGSSIHIWDASTSLQMLTYRAHSGEVKDISWSQNGIASCSSDNTIHIWNATTGKTITTYSSDEHTTTTLAWSPDGNHLAWGGNNYVEVWEVR